MEDKSLHNSQQSQGISESLQSFIDSMVEEIVLEGKPFDSQKKYLKKFSEKEGVDYNRLECDIDMFIEIMKNLKTTSNSIMMKLAEEKGHDCFISEDCLMTIISSPANSGSTEENEKNEDEIDYISNVRSHLHPVIREGKFGYADKEGRIVLQCKWLWANSFVGGIAVVGDNNELFGVIDETGCIVTPCKWKSVVISEDLMILVEDVNGGYGILDRKGNTITPCIWNYINGYLEGRVFRDGIASVKEKDDYCGLFGLIDKKGNMVMPFKWEKCSRFYKNGCASIQDDQLNYGIIDSKMNMITSCKWKFTNANVGDHICAVQDNNELWGLIDINGNQLLSCKWHGIGSVFDEELALVEDENHEFGYINGKGDMVIAPRRWKSACGFSEGMAIVESENGKKGAIDNHGRLIIPTIYEDLAYFSDGVSRAKVKKKQLFRDVIYCQYIDKNGEPIVPGKWKGGNDFNNGKAFVQNDKGMWGAIDKEGRTVIPFKWAYGDYYGQDAIAWVRDFNGDEFFIDDEGNVATYWPWIRLL